MAIRVHQHASGCKVVQEVHLCLDYLVKMVHFMLVPIYSWFCAIPPGMKSTTCFILITLSELGSHTHLPRQDIPSMNRRLRLICMLH
jgi:hypothetical protein